MAIDLVERRVVAVAAALKKSIPGVGDDGERIHTLCDDALALHAEISRLRGVIGGVAKERDDALRILGSIHRALGGRRGEGALGAAKRVARTIRECLAWVGTGTAN